MCRAAPQAASFLLPLAEVLQKLLDWLDEAVALLPANAQSSADSVWTGPLNCGVAHACALRCFGSSSLPGPHLGVAQKGQPHAAPHHPPPLPRTGDEIMDLFASRAIVSAELYPHIFNCLEQAVAASSPSDDNDLAGMMHVRNGGGGVG